MAIMLNVQTPGIWQQSHGKKAFSRLRDMCGKGPAAKSALPGNGGVHLGASSTVEPGMSN
jgi:hypothetical protein